MSTPQIEADRYSCNLVIGGTQSGKTTYLIERIESFGARGWPTVWICPTESRKPAYGCVEALNLTEAKNYISKVHEAALGIDEFSQFARKGRVPDQFLVDILERRRWLGVVLWCATQRPYNVEPAFRDLMNHVVLLHMEGESLKFVEREPWGSKELAERCRQLPPYAPGNPYNCEPIVIRIGVRNEPGRTEETAESGE